MGHRGQRLALGLRCEGVHCTQRLRLGTPISPPWSPRQKTALFPPGPSTGLHVTPESNPSHEEKEMFRDGDGVWNERQETRVLLSDLKTKTKTKTESCFQSDSLPLCLFLASPCCPTESHFLSLLLGEALPSPAQGPRWAWGAAGHIRPAGSEPSAFAVFPSLEKRRGRLALRDGAKRLRAALSFKALDSLIPVQ